MLQMQQGREEGKKQKSKQCYRCSEEAKE
jgi:hypothetical protein